MKKYLLIIIGLFLFADAYSIVDTLRTYNPSKAQNSLTGNTQFVYARFDMPAPGKIQKVILHLSGGTGTADLVIYGNEGGNPVPQLYVDEITPISVSKSMAGDQTIVVDINPNVDLSNNQFFIGLENLSSAIDIKRQIDTVAAPCYSQVSNGGTFHYTAIFSTSNGWTQQNRPLAIDVVMDYPSLTPGNHLVDVSSGIGLQTNLINNRMNAADLNEDGQVDLLVNGKVYQNNSGSLQDITSSKGFSKKPLAHIVFDSDNDDDLDVMFVHIPDQTTVLYMNDGNGNYTTKVVTEIPAMPALNSVSVADVNGDGLPDIYFGQIWTTYPNAEPRYFFLNNGNNTWTDATSTFYNMSSFIGPVRGSQFVDFDNDGDQDLFVANYVSTGSKQTSPRDEFWENDGNGNFTNIIASTPIDNTTGPLYWNFSTGCSWGDYDNDGDMDLFAPTLSHPFYMNGNQNEFTQPTTIYSNSGAPGYSFTNEKANHKIDYEETHSGGVWADINNDGLMDFFVTAYYGCRYADLYIQQPDNSFKNMSWDYGVQDLRVEQDMLWLDLNNDGVLDLLSGDVDRVRMYRNDVPATGNHVKIKLKSTTQNAYAIGAKAVVYAGGDQMMREVSVGRGQKMQDPYILHFGLGSNASVDSVYVYWPNSTTPEGFDGININQLNVLNEGDGGITQPPTSVDEVNAELTFFNVFPNPADDQLKINFKSENTSSIQLIDLLGNEVYRSVVPSGRNSIDVETSNFASGTYLLFITDGMNSIQEKVLVQH